MARGVVRFSGLEEDEEDVSGGEIILESGKSLRAYEILQLINEIKKDGKVIPELEMLEERIKAMIYVK